MELGISVDLNVFLTMLSVKFYGFFLLICHKIRERAIFVTRSANLHRIFKKILLGENVLNCIETGCKYEK